MAKDFEPRIPETPQATPTVPVPFEDPYESVVGRMTDPIRAAAATAPRPEDMRLRSPVLEQEEIDAYVFEPRRRKLEYINTLRQKYGQPPVETAPEFPADLGGDIDFEDWLDSQRPAPTTGQEWAQGAGAAVETVLGAAAAVPRLLGDKDALKHSQSMLGYPDEWGKDPEQPDISTWYGKAPRTIGGAAPFFIPGVGVSMLVGSSVGTGLDVAEQSGAGEVSRLAAGGAGALAAAEAMTLGRAMGGAVHKGLSKIAPPETVLSSVKTAAGDTVLHAAKNVPRAMGEGLAGEAASAATLMGGQAAIQGSALAAQGALTGNQGMTQAGGEMLASTPVAAAEGLAFGPIGAIRGGLGARAANRQALQANRQVLAEGAQQKGTEILAQAEPAMRDVNAAAEARLAQEAQAQQAMQAEGQRIEMDRVAKEQAAAEQIRAARDMQDRVYRQRMQQQAIAKQTQARAEAEAELRATQDVVQQPVAEAKAAEVAAQERAAEAQTKSVEEAVALARELKEVDLTTFEGQKKAADILNRKPVVEPAKDTTPVVESAPPEQAPQTPRQEPEVQGPEKPVGSWILDEAGREAYLPAEGELVSVRFGLSSKPAIFKGTRDDTVVRGDRADPIETKERIADVIVEGTNYTVPVPAKDVLPLSKSASVKTQRAPTHKLAVGDRVALQSDPTKTGVVTRTSPDDLHVEMRLDGTKGTVVKATSALQLADPAATPHRGGAIVTKGGDKQYRVLEQHGDRTRVMTEHGEPQMVKTAELSPAKKAKFTEGDVNAELRKVGANLEVFEGKVRQPGTAGTNRLFVDLLDRVFVPKTRATLENKWKSLKENPAARFEWERENRARLPDTAKEYADKYKGDIKDPSGVYEPSLNRIQLSDKASIYHELVHAFLTKYATEAERKSALDMFKKNKNREPADEVEFQEWFNNSLKKPAVQKAPAFKRFSNLVANFFRRIMGRPPKSIEEAVDTFAELRNIVNKGEWVDRPVRQSVDGEAMFDVSPKTRDTEQRGEAYRSEALDPLLTERRDRYLSADKRGQLLEDVVHAGMEARGLKDRVSVEDVVNDAVKRDLDKLSTYELADQVRISPTDNALLAEALVRADELAARGTKAADRDLVELQQAVIVQGSEVGRALAMRRWMMNTPAARSQALVERALALTPSEQRRWKDAKEKGDTATLDSIKEKAATRKEGIQKLLKTMFDIDLSEASDMRRLKDADLMFDVSTAIDAYQRTNRDFIADFKDSPIQQSWNIAHEIRMGFILSGPGTHARNIGSGIVRLTQHAFQKSLESVEYAIRHKDARAISDLKAFYGGMAAGSKQAFKNAWRSFQIGNDVGELQTYGVRDSAYETHRDATPGKLGSVFRSPRKLIVAGDSFFRTMSAEAEVSYLATRMAKQRGLTGEEAAAFVADQVTNYTSEARVQAFKRAKEQYGGELSGGSPKDLKYEHLEDWDVLRDANKTVNEWLEKHSLTKAGVDILQPFRASPAAWLRIGLGLTPLKVVSVVTKHALHAKNPEKFKYSEHSQVRDHAEMILGLALSAWATHWALEDAPDGLPRVTGILPDKMRQPGVGDKLSRLGYGNYTMYVPGFGRQSFKGYGPLTEIFAFAGAYKKATDTASTDMGRATAPIRDTLEVVLERASAVNDAMRVRDDSVAGYAAQWPARTLGGFVMPRLAKDIIDASRTGVESTAVKSETFGGVFVDTLMDETRIAQNLEKVSYFGDRIEKMEPGSNIGAKVMRVFGLGPMGASSKGDIRTIELWMHEAGHVPVPPKWKSDADVKEGDPGYYRLDDEQYRDLLVKSGQARKQIMERVTDKFRFDPDRHPEIAKALVRKIGEVSGHANEAALGVVTAKTADERAKYQTILDRISQTGHTAFGTPAGRYLLAVKQLNALKEKAQPKKKVDLRKVPIENVDEPSEGE